MIAYKGFDKDMKCRDFQYEVGGEYETDEAILCESGFHACEDPLECMAYYSPANDSELQIVPICVKTEYVDGERIKADTWYKLQNGKFTEVDEDE